MSKIFGLFKYGYGALDELGFFSPTEKTIDLLGDVKGKPEQLLNQIKNTGGPAVVEESMFTGLDKYVDELPDETITTKDLKDYLAKNKTVVKQEIQGGKLGGEVSRFQDANSIIRNFDEVEGDFYEDGQFQIRRIKPYMLSSYHREMLDFPDLPDGVPNVDFDPDALFGTDEYFRIIDQETGVVVDGSDRDGWYGYDNIDFATDKVDSDIYESSEGIPVANVPSLAEVDVQLSILEAGGEFRPEYGNLYHEQGGKYSSVTVGRGNLNTNYREILLTNESPFQKLKDDYVTEHYPEKNLIVHARVNDKITEDGKKTLFLEEIQSDWSQRGEEGKNINYTPSEQKSLINSNKPQLVKNLKNNYDKLNKISNIDDIKIYHQFTPADSDLVSNRQRTVSYSYLNDDLDNQIKKLSLKKVQVRNDPNKVAGINKQIQLLEKMKTDDLTLGNLISNKGTKYKFSEAQGEKKNDDITLNLDGKFNDFLYPGRVNEELINPLKKKVFFDLFTKLGTDMPSPRGPIFKINDLPDEDINKLSNLYFGNDKEKISKYFDTLYKEERGDPNRVTKAPTNLADIDTDKKREVLFNILRNAELTIKDLVPKHRKIIENFDVQPDKLEEGYEILKKLDANLTETYNFERKVMGTHDIPSGPFINDTGAYTEIGLKNIIRNAIDEGYEKISISPGYVHLDRSNKERLVRYYDSDVPKALNKIIKGTDAKLTKQRVFHNEPARKDFVEEFEMFGRNDPNSDTAKAFDLKNNLNESVVNPFYMDSVTLEFTPEFIKNVKSGQSLYTPIAATGLAGMLTANKIMGSEEDIITEEGI